MGRQARGDWRVYQRLHACHRCMVDYNTQALANDKVHDPSTLRALFQGVGMTGRCAIMWMLYDPQDHTKQQPMLGSGPLGASLPACRAALIHTCARRPACAKHSPAPPHAPPGLLSLGAFFSRPSCPTPSSGPTRLLT